MHDPVLNIKDKYYTKKEEQQWKLDWPHQAIQVLQGVDGIEKVDGKCVKVRKIETIHHFKTGPSLKDVLLHEDVKDLPILVFSIAGKTRQGKSFLLNLMIQYLENQSHCGWHTDRVPSCFPWNNDLYSVTDGVWICPKIYRTKNCEGKEVGIMLLDTEGLYGGKSICGETVAISGIVATISYLQMFNMSKRILESDLHGVVMNLIKGIEEQCNDEAKKQLQDDFKLMLVVRDWAGVNYFPYGLKGGKDYIQSEKRRGTKEYEELWNVIHEKFRSMKCVLLPQPGNQVEEDEFNQTGFLPLLREQFLVEVRRLNKSLFSQDNLSPQSTPVTGQDIYNILTSVDGKIADDGLSVANIITYHGNQKKVEQWKSRFLATLGDASNFSKVTNAKSMLNEIFKEAKNKLKGKSRGEFLNSLKQELIEAVNQEVVKLCFLQYKNYFPINCRNLKEKQIESWPNVKNNFQKHVCGNFTTKKNVYLNLIRKSASYYYKLLHEDYKKEFKKCCSFKNTLEECAGLDRREINSFTECEAFSADPTDREEIHPIWLKEYNDLKIQFNNILLKRVGTIAKISIGTLEKLQKKQYEYFNSLTSVDKYKINFFTLNRSSLWNKPQLAKKVGYAMFDLPETTSSVESQKTQGNSTVGASEETHYSKDQESKISRIVEKIISMANCHSSDKVYVSCIFLVHIRDGDIVSVPVFRMVISTNIYYVGSNCRHYNGWDNLLASNTLQGVFYCYPLNGRYVKSEGFWSAFSCTSDSVCIIL